MPQDKTSKQGRLSSTTHALIGAGNMGGALLNGWLKTQKDKLLPKQILVIDPSPGEAASEALKRGVKFASQLTKGSASGVKVCLLAIKPQLFEKVSEGLARALPKDSLVISIMAGTRLEMLKTAFAPRPIIRAMPNTPGSIGKGITAFICDDTITAVQRKIAQQRLAACGQVVEVKTEREIDMVTAVSGSGPAYVFYLTEALAAAGQKIGLSENLTRQLARQTVIGSGAMLAVSAENVSDLRRAVTSPGGTTEAALEIMMEDTGMPKLMGKAVKAAFDRSRELGGKSLL